MPAFVAAYSGFEAEIGDVVSQVDGFHEVADLTVLVGHCDSDRLGDCLGIHCGIEHETLFLYVEIVGDRAQKRGELLAFSR